MFRSDTSDWLRSVSRRFLNLTGQSDWPIRFLVDDHWLFEICGNFEKLVFEVRTFDKGLSPAARVARERPFPSVQPSGRHLCPNSYTSIEHNLRLISAFQRTGEIGKGPSEGTTRFQKNTNVSFIFSLKIWPMRTPVSYKVNKPNLRRTSSRNMSSKIPQPAAFMQNATPEEGKTEGSKGSKTRKQIKQEEKVARQREMAKKKLQEEQAAEAEAEPDLKDLSDDGSEDDHNETVKEQGDDQPENPAVNNDGIQTLNQGDDRLVDEVPNPEPIGQTGGATQTEDAMTAETGENTERWRLMKSALKDWTDDLENDQEPDLVGEEPSVLEQFGVNESLKLKIAALINDEVLNYETEEDPTITIEEENFQFLRKRNKTSTTRFTLVANCREDFKAERPSQDIVDEFLYLSTGLSLPFEIIAQKPSLTNKDGKSRMVGKFLFPEGLKQRWELQVVTWTDLNLNMVCGKKIFHFGRASDQWIVYLPGAPKPEEKSFYAQGICKDPTISNLQIAKQLIKQGYDIVQGTKGVKDSPAQSNFEASKSGSKYFFLKTEIMKKPDGEYNKIHIGVWSDNLKKMVQISFSVRDRNERSKTEAKEVAPKRCKACGNGPEVCTGHNEVLCSWRDINIREWMAVKQEKLQAVKPFVKNATIVQQPTVAGAEFKVRRYLTRIKKDTDEERGTRIRSFLAHNVNIAAKRDKLGEGKQLDDGGYIKVARKPEAKKVELRRTVVKPFKVSDFKVVANYVGAFGNKDKIIATIYRWPTRDHEGKREKALEADLSLGQLKELVEKTGAKENKHATLVAKVETFKEEKRKEYYAKWIDEHIQRLEDTICEPQK